MQTRRAQWTQRVQQWRHSGLTANEFADRVGVNESTLKHWAWRLGRERRERAGARGGSAEPAQFVQLVTHGSSDTRFELELGDGRRLRIPPEFDGAALERVLAVLNRVR